MRATDDNPRRGRMRTALIMLAIVSGVPGGVAMLDLYTNLRSDLEALLPAHSAAVRGVETLRQRMEGAQHLGIIVRGRRPGAAGEFARALAERSRALCAHPSALIRSIRTDVGPENPA